jgi:3-oxoacyl-[acyl-carrier protein] reductase
MDVRDKCAIVAGGLGSLGSAIAESLRERGARVVVVDANARGDESDDVLHADLSDDASFAAALDTAAERFGRVWIFVNCAGLIHSEPLVSLTNADHPRHCIETWNETIRCNLTATFVPGARVAQYMAASRTRGVIVNFSSIAASGNPGQTAYSAAKAGVEAMTRVWSRELGPFGIRVVAIAPGFVATPSTQAAMTEVMLADIKRRTPLLRLAKTADICSAVAFAIENDFVTGTTIAVDGGLVL